MHDSLPDSDAVLAQFNRLIQELLRGNMHRNTFRPWEVELSQALEETHAIYKRLLSRSHKS